MASTCRILLTTVCILTISHNIHVLTQVSEDSHPLLASLFGTVNSAVRRIPPPNVAEPRTINPTERATQVRTSQNVACAACKRTNDINCMNIHCGPKPWLAGNRHKPARRVVSKATKVDTGQNRNSNNGVLPTIGLSGSKPTSIQIQPVSSHMPISNPKLIHEVPLSWSQERTISQTHQPSIDVVSGNSQPGPRPTVTSHITTKERKTQVASVNKQLRANQNRASVVIDKAMIDLSDLFSTENQPLQNQIVPTQPLVLPPKQPKQFLPAIELHNRPHNQNNAFVALPGDRTSISSSPRQPNQQKVDSLNVPLSWSQERKISQTHQPSLDIFSGNTQLGSWPMPTSHISTMERNMQTVLENKQLHDNQNRDSVVIEKAMTRLSNLFGMTNQPLSNQAMPTRPHVPSAQPKKILNSIDSHINNRTRHQDNGFEPLPGDRTSMSSSARQSNLETVQEIDPLTMAGSIPVETNRKQISTSKTRFSENIIAPNHISTTIREFFPPGSLKFGLPSADANQSTVHEPLQVALDKVSSSNTGSQKVNTDVHNAAVLDTQIIPPNVNHIPAQEISNQTPADLTKIIKTPFDNQHQNGILSTGNNHFLNALFGPTSQTNAMTLDNTSGTSHDAVMGLDSNVMDSDNQIHMETTTPMQTMSPIRKRELNKLANVLLGSIKTQTKH